MQNNYRTYNKKYFRRATDKKRKDQTINLIIKITKHPWVILLFRHLKTSMLPSQTMFFS